MIEFIFATQEPCGCLSAFSAVESGSPNTKEDVAAWLRAGRTVVHMTLDAFEAQGGLKTCEKCRGQPGR